MKSDKKQKFISTHYGRTKEFCIGQRVQCVYYHERIQHPGRIFQPFTPVKLGVIVGDAGIRPYYLAGATGKEQYLYIKFKEYLFKKAIPISCIEDAKESAEDTLAFLEENRSHIGEKGNSQEAFNTLKAQAEKALKFSLYEK